MKKIKIGILFVLGLSAMESRAQNLLNQSKRDKRLLRIAKWLFIACVILPSFVLGQSTYLSVEDTRAVATAPGNYMRAVKPSIKLGTSVGFTESAYYTLLGLRGWSDDSGGPANELAFSSSKGIFYRTGTQGAGWTGWRRVLTENTSGNVGIGTDTTRERLSVNGNIRAHQIKVEVANWPDYVFDPSYKMRSLYETEQFIKQYGHLPEVPKAADAETNGVSLGEMNKILLKKIEELTLNAIENEKRAEKMQERIVNLERLVKGVK